LTPHAFTLVELLIVIGVIAVLIAILIPVIGQVRAASQSTACLSNLRQIMQAFNLYANAHQQHLPPPSNPADENESWESHLKEYVKTREAFRCPADNVAFENYLSSYDWRDTGDPRTTVAGKMLVEIGRPDTVFAFDALPEWHGRQRINTSWADGSAHSMDYQDWAKDLEKSVTSPVTVDKPPQNK
jgi:prepilin-type N-terminal cleavage/methylation domain-containing protein